MHISSPTSIPTSTVRLGPLPISKVAIAPDVLRLVRAGGLDASWEHGPIYGSQATLNLVALRLQVNSKVIRLIDDVM
jgi:hypothetical protein